MVTTNKSFHYAMFWFIVIELATSVVEGLHLHSYIWYLGNLFLTLDNVKLIMFDGLYISFPSAFIFQSYLIIVFIILTWFFLVAARLAKLAADKVLNAPCETSVLYPNHGGNLHCFTAVTPCAVLDVLAPPYKEHEGRKCTYYHDYPYSTFCK